MQIIFSFSESGAPTGRVIVADTEQHEKKLKDIARRMLLAALHDQQQACEGGGICGRCDTQIDHH